MHGQIIRSSNQFADLMDIFCFGTADLATVPRYLAQQQTHELLLEWERTHFPNAVTGFADRLIVFGAGELGRAVAKRLPQHGYSALCFADNSPRLCGAEVDGLGVLSTDDAVDRYGTTGCFIVAVYNGTPVRRQLRAAGCKTVLHFASLFWLQPTGCIQAEAIGRPSLIVENSGAIDEAFSSFADEKSRQVFCEQLRWHVYLDSENLDRPSPVHETYLAPDIIRSNDDEIFVDCGAFNGDSICQFLTQRANKFRRILALEPDSSNRSALRTTLDQMPAEIASRITILPHAVGDKPQKVRFGEGHLVASRILAVDPCGATNCLPLDELLAAEHATFIKMDIEGAEPDAIRGARSILNEDEPVLAACAYHKFEHLWELPLLLRNVSPRHHLYLRRYAEDCWETVCYAVPADRVIS